MSVDRLAIEEQLMDGLSLIMNAVQRQAQDVFIEISGYQNKNIPTIFMLIQKLKITGTGGVRNYFAIGFKTAKTEHITDVMDIFFDDAGIHIRGQGFSCLIADHIKGTISPNSTIDSWIKLIVSGNEDLTEMLITNREFINGLKRPRK